MSDPERRLLEPVIRIAAEYKLADEETKILVGQVLAGDIVLKYRDLNEGDNIEWKEKI